MNYERETKEFQAVSVEVDGEPLVEGFELCVTPEMVRPADNLWKAPLNIMGELGFMVENFEPGIYQVWAKVPNAEETVVKRLGEILVN